MDKLDIRYPNLGRSVSRFECYAVRARSEQHASRNCKSSSNDPPSDFDELSDSQTFSIAATVVVAR